MSARWPEPGSRPAPCCTAWPLSPCASCSPPAEAAVEEGAAHPCGRHRPRSRRRRDRRAAGQPTDQRRRRSGQGCRHGDDPRCGRQLRPDAERQQPCCAAFHPGQRHGRWPPVCGRTPAAPSRWSARSRRPTAAGRRPSARCAHTRRRTARAAQALRGTAPGLQRLVQLPDLRQLGERVQPVRLAGSQVLEALNLLAAGHHVQRRGQAGQQQAALLLHLDQPGLQAGHHRRARSGCRSRCEAFGPRPALQALQTLFSAAVSARPCQRRVRPMARRCAGTAGATRCRPGLWMCGHRTRAKSTA